MEQVRHWISDAERVTVLTGAGISTDSGIPDYRGPNGVWTKNPEAARMATLRDYIADPEVRRRSWRSRKAHPAWGAEPNAGHRALVDLEKTGRLVALVTQNVDGLHQRAGSTNVIEVHGTIWWAECLTCLRRTPMADELARVSDEEPDPACTQCGGILKSATISFGQQLDPEVLDGAARAAAGCHLLLAIGTSLSVHPAAGLCDIAVGSGARLIVVNAEPTPYDGIADAVLRDPIGEILPALVEVS
jgi:NAD-dependent deacetylase